MQLYLMYRYLLFSCVYPPISASLFCPGATKDMGKMLGGEEEKDPDAAKKEEERQEALRQQEEERKAKHARMEAEREKVRQTIRDKVETVFQFTNAQWTIFQCGNNCTLDLNMSCVNDMTNYNFLNLTKPWLCHNVNNSPKNVCQYVFMSCLLLLTWQWSS